MTLSLKCTCGVRLDVPENFAGQQITCPDCQHPVAVPRNDPALIRTSGLALTALTLALVGAFTVVGTVLAVVLGVAALIHIRRQPEAVTGQRYAIVAILLGFVLTAATVAAYTSADRLGWRNLFGRAQWAGKLDYDGPKTIKRATERYSIDRPNERWGVLKKSLHTPGGQDNPDDRVNDDLLLVNVEEDAHIVVFAPVPNDDTLEEFLKSAAQKKLRDDDPFKLFGPNKTTAGAKLDVLSTRRPPPVGPLTFMEMVVDKSMNGQERRYLVRVVQKENDNMIYLIIAGARRRNFERVEPQLRQALDSLKVLGEGP
jgi:hypothetical protein